jgi:hypothetical protein
MDDMIDKPQRNADELRKALEHVTRQMIEVEADKKASNKTYNERLADLKAERDAIVEQLGQ